MSMSRRDKDGEEIARIIARGIDALSKEEDDRLDVALAIWADYQAKLPSNKAIRKPKTHAAGVHYATSKLLDLGVTQKKISRQYHVSAGKVSKMYRIIWDKLALRRDDPRYASAALTTVKTPLAASTARTPASTPAAKPQPSSSPSRSVGALDDFDHTILDLASRDELLALARRACESSIHARQIARQWSETLSLSRRAMLPEQPVEDVLDALIFEGDLLAKPLEVFLKQVVDEIEGALERSFDDAATMTFARTAHALAKKSSDVSDEHLPPLLERSDTFIAAAAAHSSGCAPETRRQILAARWLELLWGTRVISIHSAHRALNVFANAMLDARAPRALFDAWYPGLELDRVEVRALMSRALDSGNAYGVNELRTLWERHARECISLGAHETLMRMAKAFTRHDAEVAIEILEELAAHHIDKKTRKHYELAALTLVELRGVFEEADLELGWGDFFAILEETTRGRDALHEAFVYHGLST